jgi:hypothetical protein
MPRSIQIYLPPQDADWMKASLEYLADAVITDAEAGQRGAKLSKLVHMIAAAGIANYGETARLLKEIKLLLP